MKPSRRIRLPIFLAALTLFLAGGVNDVRAAEPLLPANLVMEKTFAPGVGLPVGEVIMARGNVVIIHKENEKQGFQALEGAPLFKGDAIITPGKSRARFELNDGSIMSMGPRSRLVINKSVYDRKKKTRQSFLSLNLGKVRFWVVKALNLKRSEFKVRTRTSIGGVRGSDFIAIVTPEGTEWITLEDTLLEVRSTVDPDAGPMILEDFEQTVVKVDALPTEKWKITPEEILEIRRTLTISMTRDEPGIRSGRMKRDAAKPGDGPSDKPEAASPSPGPPPPPPPGEGVLAPRDALVDPGDPRSPGPPGPPGSHPPPRIHDVAEKDRVLKHQMDMIKQQDDNIQDKREEIIKDQPPQPPGNHPPDKEPLPPSFPGVPIPDGSDSVPGAPGPPNP